LSSRLTGKVAIVTGGTRGIGGATAAALADLDAQVVVSRLAADERPDPRVDAVDADVRRYADLVALHDQTLARHGRLDFVVANAGVADWSSMSDGEPDWWRTVLETNVLGVAQTVRATLPTLLSQGSGHIVITASISGRIAYVGEPIYIASKWALVGLGYSLRKEVGGSGVRVTLIEPGIVDTPLVSDTEEGRLELDEGGALDPRDVADAIVYALTRPAHVDVDELMISCTKRPA